MWPIPSFTPELFFVYEVTFVSAFQIVNNINIICLNYICPRWFTNLRTPSLAEVVYILPTHPHWPMHGVQPERL